MRIAILVVVACIAGAAMAQSTPFQQPTITFDRQPNGSSYARRYPTNAAQRGIEGVAGLCCTVNSDRTLNCIATGEAPAGYGFGAASAQIGGEFRVSEESYAAMQTWPDRLVRRSIIWTMGRQSDEFRAEVERVRAQMIEICRPETPIGVAPPPAN